MRNLETEVDRLATPPHPPGDATSTDPGCGTPRAGTVIPLKWRGLSSMELAKRWVDLGQWVEWLLDAYSLDGDPWMGWWWAAGAVEQLSALRDWHHELVDVTSPLLPPPEEGEDDRAKAERERAEADRRRALAHDLVLWNEAAVSVAERVAGRPEGGPLLTRAAQAAAASLKRRGQRKRDRNAAFDSFLTLLGQMPEDFVCPRQ